MMMKKFCRLFVAIVLLSTIMPSTIFAQEQSTATITVKQYGDLAFVLVSSNTDVREYQIVFKTSEGSIDAVAFSGFMGGIQLSVPGQTRWFDLRTDGTKGSVAFIFSGCITIDRINMLDANEQRISSVGLPKTLCTSEA